MVIQFDIVRGELENGNDIIVEMAQKGDSFTVAGYIRDYSDGGTDLDLFDKAFDDLADAKECFAKMKEKIAF